MSYRVAILDFPGSHSVLELVELYREKFSVDAYPVWHLANSLEKPDLVVLSGGYTFGDTIRPGALAKASLVSGLLKRFANDGGQVLGFGNGFQILCELGILPGAFLVNPRMEFLNQDAHVVVENVSTEFTKSFKKEQVLTLPLSCYYGRYFADPRTIKDIEEGSYVVFRYSDKFGEVDFSSSIVNSTSSIAGVTNRNKNVVGLMLRLDIATNSDQYGEALDILGGPIVSSKEAGQAG